MMPNWLAIFAAALVPLAIGFFWYSNMGFGKAWMRVAGMNEDSMKGSNMAVIFGLTYFFGLLLAISLNMAVIHQTHIYSILANDPGINDANSETGRWLADFNSRYGNNFRTFKHGAFHGVLSGIFFALPILGINALFERKGFKYIAIHTGYWILTLALMGGILCSWV